MEEIRKREELRELRGEDAKRALRESWGREMGREMEKNRMLKSKIRKLEEELQEMWKLGEELGVCDDC